jgi:hypothetical protein
MLAGLFERPMNLTSPKPRSNCTDSSAATTMVAALSEMRSMLGAITSR